MATCSERCACGVCHCNNAAAVRGLGWVRVTDLRASARTHSTAGLLRPECPACRTSVSRTHRCPFAQAGVNALLSPCQAAASALHSSDSGDVIDARDSDTSDFLDSDSGTSAFDDSDISDAFASGPVRCGPALTSLELENVGATGANIAACFGAPQLRQLSLLGNALGDAALPHLVRALRGATLVNTPAVRDAGDTSPRGAEAGARFGAAIRSQQKARSYARAGAQLTCLSLSGNALTADGLVPFLTELAEIVAQVRQHAHVNSTQTCHNLRLPTFLAAQA